MISLRRPPDETLLAALDAVTSADFTYPHVGSLRGDPPVGFRRDRARAKLGFGERSFHHACEALREWAMMPTEMLTIFSRDPSLCRDTVVGVLCRGLGLWTFNPCRVAYLIDETNDKYRSFGFVYATLPGHLECGEERFLCQWNRSADEVRYEVVADSRPGHILTRVGYLYARRLQRQFRSLSCRAMVCRVAEIDTLVSSE